MIVMSVLGLSVMVVGLSMGMRSTLGPTMGVGLSMGGMRAIMGPTQMVRGSTRGCGEAGFVIVMGLMEESTILRV